MLPLLKMLLLGVSFLLFSCNHTKGKVYDVEKVQNVAIEKDEKEMKDEEYQAALQQQMMGLREMDKKNQELKNKKKEKAVKEWILGTWEWTGYIFGSRTWARLIISDNSIILLSPDGVLDQGSYSIDYDTHIIHYGNYSYVEFDPVSERLFDRDNGRCEYYNKVSNSTTYSNGSYGSTSTSRNENSVAEQLKKLDDEESDIISRIDPIRRSGQFYPDILVKVMRMKQISDERIRLARRNGDANLIQYYESKKMRSEAIIRSWGFD